ncbi:oxidoreductase family protein [Paraglaciecola aquimarina]|uniref:Oxidoreductase family protein n=1 Tax=Paraglaciecola aquimarina TaxID=1235557 RepID=A0ABU3T0X4_9ALTE|nr:oxidoreductase family protein [Paraglaciecola aquimarina]MDU0355903.1 oxidoreductase family protein [Paraglaciecola aquimarina]
MAFSDYRQDELAAMADGVLKAEASRIDATLNKGLYQTLVHGDAKLANFCFADESIRSPIAAVDFQYVGKGVGVKDLAYFLGSCLSAKDLAHNASILVDEYFSQLEQAMSEYQVVLDFAKLEAEWRYLYAFAWADFQRFLLGWSPSHSKINCYMQQQTQLALSQC